MTEMILQPRPFDIDAESILPPIINPAGGEIAISAVVGTTALIGGIAGIDVRSNQITRQRTQALEPVNRELGQLKDDGALINQVLRAVSDKNYSLFIRTVRYDGKPHIPLSPPYQRDLERLNSQFQAKKTTSELGATFRRVEDATSPTDAVKTLLGKAYAVDDMKTALSADVKRVETKYKPPDFGTWGGAAFIGGAVLGAAAGLAALQIKRRKSESRHKAEKARTDKIAEQIIEETLSVIEVD